MIVTARFLAFSLLLLSFNSAVALQCKHFFKPSISREFSPTKPVRFMSLNTLNLYLHQGKYEWTEQGYVRVNQDELPQQKPERHTQGLADAILESQPDFIMLQEVEGFASLDRFNRRYLDGAYKAFLPQTNDSRGIGVAFLVREGTGVTVKRRSYTKRKWVNKKGVEEPIFTRNFPVFEIYFENSQVPKLIVAGVHYKSRIDRPNDPKSFYKRQKEVDESVKILKDLKGQHPGVPMLVMGDFNSSPEQKELAAFYHELQMLDAHSLEGVFEDPAEMGRSTFTYFPYGGEKKERAFDLALMTADLAENLLSSSVYRYKSSVSGLVLPKPKTIEERNEKPSDHYPIIFDLKPDVLYSEFNSGE